MNNEKVIVGESNCHSIGRNYNKIAILSEMLKGREVVIMDDVGEEYKSLRDVLGTDNNIKITNWNLMEIHTMIKW